MQYRKFLSLLVVVLILSLAIFAMPAKPAMAAPAITLSPSAGTVESLVVINGTGFTSSATYQAYFAYGTIFQVLIRSFTTTATTITEAFYVPAVPGASYTVFVQNVTTPSDNASATFVMTSAITLNKNQAQVGEQVTVSGIGFSPSQNISVTFDNVSIASGTSNANGSFSIPFNVPSSARASHTVKAADVSFAATATFTTLQSITVSPISGRTGSTVTVNGTGFRASQTVTITYNGVAVTTNPASIVTSTIGAFSATFAVPAGFVRSASILASDGTYSATANFTLLASISLSPTSGTIGSQVTVTGNGFGTDVNITISLDSIQAGTATSDSQGSFSATVIIPPGSAGEHTITASDGTNSATAEFNIQTSLSINPVRGPTGAQVTIKGTGFGGGKLVGIRFANTQIKNTATDPNGSFTDTFVVPQTDAGNYTVVATDGTNSASVFFTVTVSISLNQNSGNVGTSLTISGRGFSGTVTVKYDGTTVTTATAGANGVFSATFSAPPSVRGDHIISVSDGTNTLQATFTMESTPPPVPSLLAPINLAKMNAQPVFDWTPVSDPSGVSYSLQIASDASFSSMVTEKQGLTTSEYTLTRAERLPSTTVQAPYYWRVKAIDGASNESAWSPASMFYVSFLPDWAKFALFGIGGLVFVLLIFWLGMRIGMRRAKG